MTPATREAWTNEYNSDDDTGSDCEVTIPPGGEPSPGLSMVSNPRAGELRALVVPLEKVFFIRHSC